MATKWLTVKEAAELSKMHPETVRDALRAKSLRGVQKSKWATWRTQEAWVDNWLSGEMGLAA